MKTKQQKTEQIEKGIQGIKTSKSVVITDFTGLSANEVNNFRRTLRELGAKLVVMKKRLLKISLQKEQIDIDPKQFEGQAGVVFSDKGIVETSGVVFKFGKQFAKKNIFKILAGYDGEEKKALDGETVKKLGQIPPREVLLGQLVGMLTSPMRSFVIVLNEKAKKSN
jgi:large subunit ribosomal protein L10